MTTAISELYDALVDAGATLDKARSASEAVADFDRWTAEIAKDASWLKGGIAVLIAFNLSLVAGVASLVLKAYHG